MSIIHDAAQYQLRHALRGHVYDPGEPEYEDACTLFNGMVHKRPRHVARVSHPHQVSAVLAFARARDLRVAVRAGGHSVAGLSLVDDGLVIDVRGLREQIIDPVRRVARVGGGLTWRELRLHPVGPEVMAGLVEDASPRSASTARPRSTRSARRPTPASRARSTTRPA
jgi:hypothetical protein